MDLKQEAIETIEFIKENKKDLIAAIGLFAGGYIWTILMCAIFG